MSRLNVVQKETMWSLILYVVCMYVCMYVYVCGNLQNWSLYPHTLMYSHGTWTQWSLDKVTHVTSTDVRSKVIWGSVTFGSSFSKKVHCIHILWCIFMGLGHNDPWVESHMWPQQMGGVKRSSTGQWPLVQVFLQKKSLYPHTLMYFHGTWTQWSLGSVTHKISTDVGSKVI